MCYHDFKPKCTQIMGTLCTSYTYRLIIQSFQTLTFTDRKSILQYVRMEGLGLSETKNSEFMTTT